MMAGFRFYADFTGADRRFRDDPPKRDFNARRELFARKGCTTFEEKVAALKEPEGCATSGATPAWEGEPEPLR